MIQNLPAPVLSCLAFGLMGILLGFADLWCFKAVINDYVDKHGVGLWRSSKLRRLALFPLGSIAAYALWFHGQTSKGAK